MYRILIECLLLFILASKVDCYLDVEIDSGVVRGYTANDGDYFAFLGIPYAAPPLGDRRFKGPLPAPLWKNVFNANRTVQCPQLGKGDEDCLIVNVFTPVHSFNETLPVLVYFHGGSFLIGSAPTKGIEPLIKENVIVVTVNYRLGALGFLCLGINEAPGNAGLKDQIAALKWVQRNIGEFGGDSNNVTIYGMSAGGASVDLLVLSSASKGLFNKAIVESGIATAVWSVDAKPVQTAMDFAKAYNFDKKNLYMLVDFFKRLPASDLSKVNMEFFRNLTDGTIGFVPCVEKKLFGNVPFITESPQQIIKKKTFNKVPMMFIFANLEGLFLKSSEYYDQNYKDKMEHNFKDFLPADLIFDTDEIKDQVIENVRYFYFENKTIGDDTLMQYFDYFGDSLVLHGLLNQVVSYSKHKNPVYLMEFAYKGQLGTFDKFFELINMAGHGDAVKHVILNKPALDPKDKVAVNRMTKIISNFMKFSDPIPSRTDLLSIHWPAVQPNNVTCLRFDSDLQVIEEPHWEKKVFWDRIYEVYRKDIKPVDTGML